jgi:hypothetical protein
MDLRRYDWIEIAAYVWIALVVLIVLVIFIT